jgi:NAD(P)H dehydrogenase (quinone)
MKLAVIYDSVTGNTKQAAGWIAQGMRAVNGVEAEAFPVDEVDAAFASESKGIVIGCPSYMASMTPKMREWLMKAGGLGLAGKLGGAFSTVQYTHGGGELVIQSILAIELCFGMLCFSGGASFGKPCIHLGPVAVNGNVERHNDMEHYRETFQIYGERFAHKAMELFA